MKNKPPKMKYLILDVDGVLTTGQFLYTENGKFAKIFGPHDNDGIKMIRKHMEVMAITADKRGFPITKKRVADDMGLPLFLVSEEERMDWFLRRKELKKTIYIGDGIFDAKIFEKVGYSIAPNNAFYVAKEKASFVTKLNSGEGAVAEACLHIIDKFISEDKSIQMIPRNESVVTGKKSVVPLYTFKDFPVFFGCVDTPKSQDLYADMEWGIDKETGVIQLTKLIPLEILYQAQHVDGCGPTWQKYYEDFAKYIASSKPKKVLEIGGGQGQLAEIATTNSKNLRWIIVEPNPTYEGSKKIKIISSFFDENFKSNEKVDTVVFSQLLEHIYNPRQFLNAIAGYLKPGGKLVFAYPNLVLWLKRKYTNALNFEHTMFLTDYFVDYLLKESGFEIIEKNKYKDHSYFYTAIKSRNVKGKNTFTNHYNSYKNIFMNFIKYHRDMVKDLNNKISKSKRPVYCFGAHIFTTYLISFGLKTDKIVKILDNSPTKKGKRLYGTSLFVDSPKILEGKGKVNLILKAGIYNEEIKKDILENINSDVVFW